MIEYGFSLACTGISDTDRRSVISAAGLNDRQQQMLLNFERLGVNLQQSRGGSMVRSTTICICAVWKLALFCVGVQGIFSRLGGGGAATSSGARRAQAKTPASADETYADSRHVPRLRDAMEQLIEGARASVCLVVN
jgi:hypothetical protein